MAVPLKVLIAFEPFYGHRPHLMPTGNAGENAEEETNADDQAAASVRNKAKV